MEDSAKQSVESAAPAEDPPPQQQQQQVTQDRSASESLLDSTADSGPSSRRPPPPPSPLTGCYLLIVIGEPHSDRHKEVILQKISKGFLSWDVSECHVSLEKELQSITVQSPEGEEARYGERLIQYATENLVTEILIHPQLNTLHQCMKNLLSSFTKHRHIIHAGYTFAGNGSWILQDGTLSISDLVEALHETEVLRVLKAYENSVTIDVHCAAEGDWTTDRFQREPVSKLCKIRINPGDVMTAGDPAISAFMEYLSPFLEPANIQQLLQPTDVVGNIRFTHPTLYVFPGGQGDAALFGINGFNMLVDGGFSRKACFWDFARHLDRLDAVLLTRLNNSTVNGISAVLQRKKMNHVYPQIGHFFCNLQDRKIALSPDGDKDKDSLIVNLAEEGQEIVANLKHLALKPHPCYRDGNQVDPVNLYHKVGHGKLDMYVISPARDSQAVKEFLSKWSANDNQLFSNTGKKLGGKGFDFPIQNLVSICALLVWQPANPNDTITRILFPGSTPQHKIFEGLEKLRHLEFLKHPVCSARSISPSASSLAVSRSLLKARPVDDKRQRAKSADNAQRTKPKATKPVKLPEKSIKKADTNKLTEEDQTLLKDNIFDKDEKIESLTKEIQKIQEENAIHRIESEIKKIDGDGEKQMKKVFHRSKYDMKNVKSKVDSRAPSKSIDRKKAEKKTENGSPPVTPKKSMVNGTATKGEKARSLSRPGRSSPGGTPGKSVKDANNRKVVEARVTSRKVLPKTAKKEEVTSPVAPTPPVKIEKKSISRRSKAASPARKASSPAPKPKAARPEVEAIAKKVLRKLPSDKGGTDSTVSTPSADVEPAITKSESKVVAEEPTRDAQEAKTDLGDMTEPEATKVDTSNLTENKETDEEAVNVEEATESKSPKESTANIEIEINRADGEDYLIITKEEPVKVEITESGSLQEDSKTKDETEGEGEIKKIHQDEEDSEKKRMSKDELPKDEGSESPKSSDRKDAKDSERLNDIDEGIDLRGSVSKDHKEGESLPEEKFSTTVETSATTAPTLPEDEKIEPEKENKSDEKKVTEEDEDKEVEEKYAKEDVKYEPQEEKRPGQPTYLAQIPDPAPAPVELTHQRVHPRDLVKTPDEVADLPVHEEVDPGMYSSNEFSMAKKEDAKDIKRSEKGEAKLLDEDERQTLTDNEKPQDEKEKPKTTEEESKMAAESLTCKYLDIIDQLEKSSSQDKPETQAIELESSADSSPSRDLDKATSDSSSKGKKTEVKGDGEIGEQEKAEAEVMVEETTEDHAKGEVKMVKKEENEVSLEESKADVKLKTVEGEKSEVEGEVAQEDKVEIEVEEVKEDQAGTTKMDSEERTEPEVKESNEEKIDGSKIKDEEIERKAETPNKEETEVDMKTAKKVDDEEKAKLPEEELIVQAKEKEEIEIKVKKSDEDGPEVGMKEPEKEELEKKVEKAEEKKDETEVELKGKEKHDVAEAEKEASKEEAIQKKTDTETVLESTSKPEVPTLPPAVEPSEPEVVTSGKISPEEKVPTGKSSPSSFHEDDRSRETIAEVTFLTTGLEQSSKSSIKPETEKEIKDETITERSGEPSSPSGKAMPVNEESFEQIIKADSPLIKPSADISEVADDTAIPEKKLSYGKISPDIVEKYTSGQATPEAVDKIPSGKATPEINRKTSFGQAAPESAEKISSGQVSPDIARRNSSDQDKSEVVRKISFGQATSETLDKIGSGKATPDTSRRSSAQVIIESVEKVISEQTSPDITRRSSEQGTFESSDKISSGQTTPDMSKRSSTRASIEAVEKVSSGQASPDITKKSSFGHDKLEIVDKVSSGQATPDTTRRSSEQTAIEVIEKISSEEVTSEVLEKIKSGQATPEAVEQIRIKQVSSDVDRSLEQATLQISSKVSSGQASPEFLRKSSLGQALPEAEEEPVEATQELVKEIGSGQASPNITRRSSSDQDKSETVRKMSFGQATSETVEKTGSGKATPDMSRRSSKQGTFESADKISSGQATPDMSRRSSAQATMESVEKITSDQGTFENVDKTGSGKATPDMSRRSSTRASIEAVEKVSSEQPSPDISRRSSKQGTFESVDKINSGQATPDMSRRSSAQATMESAEKITSEQGTFENVDKTGSGKATPDMSRRSSTRASIEAVEKVSSEQPSPDISKRSSKQGKFESSDKISSGQSTPDMSRRSSARASIEAVDKVSSGQASPDITKKSSFGQDTLETVDKVSSGQATPDFSRRSSGQTTLKTTGKISSGQATPDISRRSSEQATLEIISKISSDHVTQEVLEKITSGKTTPKVSSGSATPDVKETSSGKASEAESSGKSTPEKNRRLKEDFSEKITDEGKLTPSKDISGRSTPERSTSGPISSEKDVSENITPVSGKESPMEKEPEVMLSLGGDRRKRAKSSSVSSSQSAESAESGDLVQPDGSLTNGFAEEELEKGILESEKQEKESQLTDDISSGEDEELKALEQAEDADESESEEAIVRESLSRPETASKTPENQSSPKGKKNDINNLVKSGGDDNQAAVRRMLVTASSEDGGAETKICAQGSIRLSKPERQSDDDDEDKEEFGTLISHAREEYNLQRSRISSANTPEPESTDEEEDLEAPDKEEFGSLILRARKEYERSRKSSRNSPEEEEIVQKERKSGSKETFISSTISQEELVSRKDSSARFEELRRSSLEMSPLKTTHLTSDSGEDGLATSSFYGREEELLEYRREKGYESFTHIGPDGERAEKTYFYTAEPEAAVTSFMKGIPEPIPEASEITFHTFPTRDSFLPEDFSKAVDEHRTARGEYLGQQPSEDKKDVIEGWGKPLGLPLPPKSARNAIISGQNISTTSSLSTPSDNSDSITNWGHPMNLPSPAPPSGNQETPKKKPNQTKKNVLVDNRSSGNNTPSRRSESPVKQPEKRATSIGRNRTASHLYLDLTYVPHHGNSYYSNVEFFKRVRARYYVFSGTEPSKEVYNALLEAKQTWDEKDLEVTIIPTYDTDVLGYWVAENEEILAKNKIDLSPSASRCTINLQDHETSCSAYRLEF